MKCHNVPRKKCQVESQAKRNEDQRYEYSSIGFPVAVNPIPNKPHLIAHHGCNFRHPSQLIDYPNFSPRLLGHMVLAAKKNS